MAAAAIAPLMIGLQAAHAQPALTISSDTSSPVATATAVSGGPGDITLSSGSTFTIKDTTPAFTLNSNNSVTNSGTITSNNIDNATGILVQGPFTGTVTNAGSINLSESYSASDSANSDGIAEAPFAQGSNRIGIRVFGPLTGTVSNTGSITIQGNNSAAISIENTLAGKTPGSASLINSGTVTVTGDNAYGVRTTGEITGDVNISGSITMKGAGSVGVQTNGQVDGALRVYGTVTTTGYAITTRQTGQIQTNIQKTPADVQQGGPALQITGNVQGGVFLGAPPLGTVATDLTTDADGDGVVDSQEGSSSLTSFGSAPALQIGGSGVINLGNFSTTNSLNTYGLIIEGTVSGQGVMDGVSATAVNIGSGRPVNLNGGLRAAGNINATAYQADATAIHIQYGVMGGAIVNSGAISANVTSASANTATGIQLDDRSSIGSIYNSGTITATTTGDSANAIVIVDHSGAVKTVTNTGVINANQNPALPGETITGKGVALDLSANTTGVTLLQQATSADAVPAIIGDVYLGSGPNTVELDGGYLTGTLNMGSAPGSLTINGATYTGALLYSGQALTINVPNGVLIDKSATTVNATSLTVGSASTISVALDPAHGTSTYFNVSGAATFASGAKIGATLLSTPTLSGQTFTVLKAGTLSVGSIDSSLLSGLPYLFTGSLSADTAANTISINVRTKTPTEMAFNKAEKSAFNAIYAALPQDTGVQTAIITAPDRNTLVSAYDQLLPNSSGDVFNTALGMSKAVSRAAADRFDLSTQRDDEDDEDFVVSGFWASEFYSSIDQNKVDNNAYHSAALGVIGGYDFGGTGVTLSAASSNITRPHQAGDSLNSVSVVEGSFYAEPRFGPVSIDARLGAGYVKASNRRQLVTQVVSGDLSTTSTVSRTADGDWSGYDLTAHLGAGLQLDVSKHLFFEPRVYADVFHMHENAYNERNGGLGYDFNVSARDGTQTNGTASVVTGLRFGNLFVISPQLEVGYDKVITGGPGDTTARFAYGGPAFTVAANHIDGAAMGRLTLRGDGNYVHFSLQAGGEYNSNYHSLDAKAVFRLTF